MFIISENSFKEKEVWTYQAMWYGLLSWFVMDSGVSTYQGAIHNVLLMNVIALVLIGIPLIITRQAFSKKTNEK